jgi:hypothetical protein
MKHLHTFESFINENFNINEAKLKDNSYQAVLFGKNKRGKWVIIKSTDPYGKIKTKEDLYPRGPNKPTDKFTEYCIISRLGGNRGESLQSDAEKHAEMLNSGAINYDTASERWSNVEFL